MSTDTSTVLSLDIQSSVTERAQLRVQKWETDFEKNHKAFAESMASGIAQEVVKEFQQMIKDPYKKSFSNENRFVTTISLDITKGKNVKKITDYTQKAAELAPFKEWLATFTPKEKPKEDNEHMVNRSKLSSFTSDIPVEECDKEYFRDLMAIVGGVAEKN